MKTTKWAEFKAARLSPERIARLSKEAEAELSTLRAVRDALDVTQVELARRTGISQGDISRIEKKDSLDGVQVGTLRKVAAGLGGELDIGVVVNGRRVAIG